MVALPVAVPVKLTEQIPPEREQLVTFREPDPVEAKFTVLAGVIGLPVVDVSVTVAVQ